MRTSLEILQRITLMGVLATPVVVGTQQPQIVDKTKQYNSGQTVAPVYEGWLPHDDGTVTLYFGYMNRNYEEVVDIPVGPANRFDPGVDRGQPAHFLPRRHLNVFQVVVPKNFGRLEWVISFRGSTEKAVATLNPQIVYDGSLDSASGFLAPAVKVDPAPTASVLKPVPLNISATHEGGRLTVTWNKYRGPGDVTFASNVQEIKDGKATTTAVFTKPGEYVLLATVAPARVGRICCWTNAQVGVTVSAPADSGGR
jgi:hypothetical protein